MLLLAHGVHFEAPDGFAVDEVSYALRAKKPVKEGRVLNKQTSVRPNLVVRRQRLDDPTDLGTLAGRLVAEVLQDVPDLERPTQERVAFADGAPGLLLAFDYPVADSAVCLRQYQALRLDETTVTNVLLTVDKNTLSPVLEAEYRRCLLSASVVADLDHAPK